MYGHVTEDASGQPSSFPRPDTHRSRQRQQTWILAVTVCLFAGSELRAQEELRATVRELDTTREWIHLPLNKSVVIESNLPAVRQQTLSPEIAQIQPISPTQILVTGQSIGRTQVIIWSADGQQQVFEISVEMELDLLTQAISKLDPLAEVIPVTVLETVVLTGTVSDADAAERIFQIAQIFVPNVQNHLQVAGQQQVMLRCKVAEVSKSAMRDLGVNFYLFGDDFSDFQLTNNIGDVNPSFLDRPAFRADVDIPLIGTAIQGGNPTLSIGLPNLQTTLFIEALRENGLTRILAEPTLVTISGRTAAFLAGGEFPVPIPQTGSGAGGNVALTIEFKEFGVRLAFTPIVLANDRIRMNVAPEISQLDFSNGVVFSGFVVPGLDSRRVETTVEIGSGQTMVIAGLLSETMRATIDAVPGLGDVPILGALFRSSSYERDITDLVIIVTPDIVAPLNPSQVGMLPGEDMLEPDAYELYMLGLDEGRHPLSPEEQAYLEGEPPPQEPEPQPENEAALLGPWGQSDSAEAD